VRVGGWVMGDVGSFCEGGRGGEKVYGFNSA
jgi:hypothetical protein